MIAVVMNKHKKAKFSAILDMILEWSLAYWIFIGICYLIINSFNK